MGHEIPQWYRSTVGIEEGKNHTESMQSVRSYLLFLLGVLVVQGLRYSDFVKDYKVIDENYHFYDEIEMKIERVIGFKNF
jgi:hypothetical protein